MKVIFVYEIDLSMMISVYGIDIRIRLKLIFVSEVSRLYVSTIVGLLGSVCLASGI
jgi:hypothetical protein